MSDQERRDCEHGQLARQCRICELEAEIARLKAPPDDAQLRAIAEREQNTGKGPWNTKHAGGETRRLPLEKAQRMREIAKLAETPTEDQR